jgi:peptidoglycan/LPS O-acetylase OafA/YrhL
MSTDIQRLSFIDALRGYAILGVIAVHSGQLFPGLETPFRLVADQGARGVQLFFVVSALTLSLSWHARCDGALPFYVRRVFRIAPMFWLAMIYYMALNPTRYWMPTGISWPNILASATFVHGFHPDVMGSIVPGGWTIADEMTFYALLPLLILTIRSWQAALFATFGLGCLVWTLGLFRMKILAALFPTTSTSLLSDFSGHLFLCQLPVFLVGILVFQLLRSFSERLPRDLLRIGLVCAIVLTAALPFSALLLGHVHWMIFYLLLGYPDFVYSIAFGLIAFCLAQGVGGLLVNAPIRYIGKVSYSAYFWHFVVLEIIGRAALDPLGIAHLTPAWPYYLAAFAAAVALTTLGSTLTFYLIEAPMIAVGRRLAAKAAAKQAVGYLPPTLAVDR